jgi:hypothetical protein
MKRVEVLTEISMEFPALTHTNASIYIAPSFDRDLDLDLPLVSAKNIQLTRNIKRFALPPFIPPSLSTNTN